MSRIKRTNHQDYVLVRANPRNVDFNPSWSFDRADNVVGHDGVFRNYDDSRTEVARLNDELARAPRQRFPNSEFDGAP